MRKCIIILLISFIVLPTYAQKNDNQIYKRVTFGLEWNYIGSFNCLTHNNFFSELGYRVDYKNTLKTFKSNADVAIHCGYNINKKWNISLYTGVSGVYDINKIIPLTIRASRFFPQDKEGDRFFLFLDGGSGITISDYHQATASAKIGSGYRLALSEVSSLDFLFAFRMTLTHPELEYDGYYIPLDKINRNNALVSAFSIGMALTL